MRTSVRFVAPGAASSNPMSPVRVTSGISLTSTVSWVSLNVNTWAGPSGRMAEATS
ncbi:MAG: hypothetical protein JXB13_22575 [Phycisphaerae bacterium]|nr:hypothetical protein [Phycisphaerae bacterium]